MRRHAARILESKIKTNSISSKNALPPNTTEAQTVSVAASLPIAPTLSVSNKINHTFQEKLQELLNFNIQAHNEAISKYVRELQGKIGLEEEPTRSTDTITTNITYLIEGNIDRVNKLANLIQDLIVNYPDLFRQFSKFCNNFYDLGLNRENVQRTQILAKTARSLELDPIKLELWLTGVASQKRQAIDYANSNDTRHNNDSFNKVPIIEDPCPKNIDAIVFSKLIQYKSDPQAKSLEKLLSEMIFTTDTKDIEDNSESNNYQSRISELQIKYQKIVEYYKGWANKGAKEIHDWAKGKKNNLNDEDICEAIAVMDRANELVTGGYRLRDTQILAVLSFLSIEENKGKLCQIQTGEGKTTIVSLLAVIKRLQGEKVDIITSNNVLAAEGVAAREDFYSLFGFSVATNNPDNNHGNNEDTDNGSSKKDQEEPKICYRADIVYGSISNFQFDYLKDSFLGYGTLAGREFGTVILDEVDSMLVDNGRHIAKLANPFPGMESLRYVYIKIWHELHKAEQKLASFPITKKIEIIKARIKAANPTDTDLIPKYLKAYAEKQLDKWIDNALYAKYACHENQQYIIKSKNGEGIITPVDYMNTGVNLNNTVWPYGLHQFLQLKHNLHLTTETLTNSHVSNMHYIKKYGSKIFGMTGTLGSNAEKSLLSKIYNVDHTEIPTYKEKKFTELAGIIIKDSNWLDSIILGILEQINLSRAVLVICETIQDVKIIKQSLELFKSLDKNAINTIKTYVDEDDAKITKDRVSSRDIIIATNIAGRGTDLETVEELNQYGGLHVCVTFLPSNQRVEDQAFGRTARQGNTGSGQLIIRESEIRSLGIIKPLEDIKIHEVKEFRNEAEKLRVQNILDKVVELDLQDELFHCFSNLYQELREKNKHIEGFHFVLEDLKEYWAFWLERQELKTDNLPKLEIIEQKKNLTQKSEQHSPIKASAEQVFAKFTEEAKILIEGQKAYQDGIETNDNVVKRIIHNPYHSIKQAEYFVQKNNLRNNKLSKAEDALKQAIFLSGSTEILPSAYITLFELEIERSWHLIRKFTSIFTAISNGTFIIKEPESSTPNANYQDIAKQYLEKAKKPLEKEINYLREFFKINNDFNLILLPESSKDSNQDMLNHTSLKASIVYRATDTDYFHLKSKEYDQEVVHKVHGIIELAELLNKYQDDINNKPICIHYCNKNNNDQNAEGINNVITIYILKDNDHISILYDDPLGNKMPYDIIWLLTKYCHNQRKQIDPVDQMEQLAKMFFLEQEGVIVPMAREAIKEETIHSGNEKSYQEELLQRNLLLKHLYSKLVCLKIQQDNIDELIKKLSSVTGDLIINSRNSESKYFQKIASNKEVITSVEIAELEHIGLGNIYGLNTVQELTHGTTENITRQVCNGLSLLKTAEEFPFLSLIMKQVSYILIAEGISNLTSELINHKEESLSCNQLFYLNGRIINEAISLIAEEPVTFIEKIMQYTIKSYQELIVQESLPSVISLYEELHNQQIAIIQEFLDKVNFDQTKTEQEYTNLKDEKDSEVVPYDAYQTQDLEQMQGQDVGLIGCD
ncbi:helicase-related protein [Candidatus Tisiphia endosymbiont of Ditula angustiorana]|uniref:helicase-related protein n=1 Tax=Candidatus Tisiphia endosymbiont of Ditula angustiorana TaxID=3066272 RepID=UPI00312CBADD